MKDFDLSSTLYHTTASFNEFCGKRKDLLRKKAFEIIAEKGEKPHHPSSIVSFFFCKIHAFTLDKPKIFTSGKDLF